MARDFWRKGLILIELRQALKMDDWPLQHPKGQPMEVVRQIRDDIKGG